MLLELLLSFTLMEPVRTPSKFERLVANHVDAIMKKGYAQNLSLQDFYHGHIIVKKPKSACYSSSDDLTSNVEMILYHTAEHNGRWRSESEAGLEHVPRSIVGFKDGSVAKAIDLVKYEGLLSKSTYELFGTIYSDDLILGKEQLQDGSRIEDPTCVFINGVPRDLNFQFYITPEKKVIISDRESF